MIQLILRFSWRNIRRNRRRTALTLLALVIGMVSLIFGHAYIEGITRAMVEPTIRLQNGHIRLAHPDYLRLERILPKERFLTPLDRIESLVSASPGVTTYHKMIRFRSLIAHGDQSEGGVVIGLSANAGEQGMKLAEYISEGRFFDPDQKELVIGKGLARELGVRLGDELLLVTTDINHSTYALPFQVTGLLEIGFSFLDRNALLIPFERASEMLDMDNMAHELLLFTHDPHSTLDLAKGLGETLKGVSDEPLAIVPWQENSLIKSMAPLVTRIWNAILFIMMFLVALVILNTMLMTVMERFREIGILKALGFKNREVIAMIFCEAGFIGLIGTAIGGLLGTVLTSVVAHTGIDLGQALNPELLAKAELPISFIGRTLHPLLTPAMVISAIVFGLLTAWLAVIYPAYKSRGMTAVEAFRTELNV